MFYGLIVGRLILHSLSLSPFSILFGFYLDNSEVVVYWRPHVCLLVPLKLYFGNCIFTKADESIRTEGLMVEHPVTGIIFINHE